MPDAATCWLCGRPTEPPFTIATSRLPEEFVEAMGPDGPPAETGHVVCGECVEGIEEDRKAVAELAAEDAAAGLGTRCGLCRADLDPPGGYALKAAEEPGGFASGGFDLLAGMPKMLRVCRRCHDIVMEERRRRGVE